MHFSVCVCLCSMCLAASTVAHWQVGLWHLQYINTPHNTSALCKLSPSHTSAFLSLVSIFSPHLFRLSLSLSSSLPFSLSFSCQTCQSFWWRVFELRLRMLMERFLRVSEETGTSAGQRKLITDWGGRVQTNKYDRSISLCQRVGRCVFGGCTGRTRQAVGNSSLNLPSIAVVMGHLLIGKGSKVLLRNKRKSAQQMCREVNMFPSVCGWGQGIHLCLAVDVLPLI